MRSVTRCMLVSAMLTFCLVGRSAWSADVATPRIKVLIVIGPQKYHSPKDTTPVLKEMLEKSGRFVVDVSSAPDTPSPDYRPAFEKYDVVVVGEGFGSNPWPQATREAFEAYMRNGGGMVSYHAADNAWPDWQAYNEMTGIGGWAGRDEKCGPYLYMDEAGHVIRDTKPGKGGNHGRQTEFEITVRDAEHPIMKGLPKTFMHGPDELYSFLRGPARNVTILATAHSDPTNRGSGHEEPMLMTIEWGKGRVFHTVLGHQVKQIQRGSFVTTFLRGTEWAATGKVTIPVPAGFPDQPYPPQAAESKDASTTR